MGGSILMIEAHQPTRARVSDILTRALCKVDCPPPDQFWPDQDGLGGYDLIILGAENGQAAAIQHCIALKSQPLTAMIPVVLLVPSWESAGAAGFAAGAEDVLTRDLEDRALLGRVRSLVRMKLVNDEIDMRDRTSRDLGLPPLDQANSGPGTVLVAADDATLSRRWQHLLRGQGHDVHVARGAADVLAAAPDIAADAIVLHEGFAASAGLAAIADLRTSLATRTIPILFVPAKDGGSDPSLALDLGAADYILPPVAGVELCERIAALVRRKRMADRLRARLSDVLRQALTDSLTGLHNRRYAEAYLDRHLAQGTAQPTAVLLLDLDRFKAVNDRYGHAAGDAVLREVAGWISATVRSVDLVARLGGEEFLVILPETDSACACQVAERIRSNVRRAGKVLPGPNAPAITVSVGVAVTAARQGDSPENLIERADRALYASKRAGRDRVSEGCAA